MQSFTLFRPKWEFSAINPPTYLKESEAGEADHTTEWDLGHVQHPKHLYTYSMEPPRFWWVSDASKLRFGETLDPMEESQSSRVPL